MGKQPSISTPGRLDCALVTFYFPPRIGGIEQVLARLAGAMAGRASIAVLAPEVRGSAAFDSSAPFEVIRRPLLAEFIGANPRRYKILYPLVSLLLFFWTVTAFASRRPRVLWSGSADFSGALACAALVLGSDFCFIAHGKDAHVRRGSWARIMKRGARAWAMRRARAIFVYSRFIARELDPEGRWGSKIVLIKAPVPAPADDPHAVGRARQSVEALLPAGVKFEDADLLLSVGRLHPRKGFQHAIAALALIRPQFPRAVYAVVGSGDFESELRREAAKRGVADRVLFLGPQVPPDPFYALAKVFVTVTWESPGEMEGFGLVFIEAAARGVPSIAGNSGGMPEAVRDGETGLCVPGASPEAIAEALRKLLGNAALREEMGARAKARAEGFTPENGAEAVLTAMDLPRASA